ncbi:PQQ-binding-like beta-propeller repeat protein [Methylomonas sp. AM2-LC]|uniref:outer membrane protein assembly factor BamB family protein n=1 Tax=Methylomonas sp. AM2-LC TaxID=3153301 RepID=UPI0032674D1D
MRKINKSQHSRFTVPKHPLYRLDVNPLPVDFKSQFAHEVIADVFLHGKLMALTLGFVFSITALATQSASAAVSTGAAGEWLQDGGGPQGIRYSELGYGSNEINKDNVSSIKQKYVLATYRNGSSMGAPLYVASERMIYALTGSPNVLLAWDVSSLPAGSTSPIPPTWSSTAIAAAPSSISKGLPTSSNQSGANCCGGTNRGMAYAKATINKVLTGLIVYNLLDGHTVAVNAHTGALVWKTTITNTGLGVTTSGQPVVTGDNGQVILGTSSGEMGTRGYVVALDLATGKPIWNNCGPTTTDGKCYTTGPDADVGIVSGTQYPFPNKDKGKDLGKTSWPATTQNVPGYLLGGSSVWSYLTYDPENDYVLYGTSQPGVWNPELRPGDNKWGASIFARKVSNSVANGNGFKAGEVAWVYQVTQHDNWDFDAIAEILPVNLNTAVTSPTDASKSASSVAVQFNKNGFVYTFDRKTGTLISADQFKDQNWAGGGIDTTSNPNTPSTATKLNTAGLPLLADGTPATSATGPNNTIIPGTNPKYNHTDQWGATVCPSPLGAHGWEPSSYSPKVYGASSAGLFFVPTFNFCASLAVTKAQFISGAPYMGMDMSLTLQPGATGQGTLMAWDLYNHKPAWKVDETYPLYGGILSTAGDIVFYTTLDKSLKAVNAENGAALFKANLECSSVGNPMTFIDGGKQFVAIYSGIAKSTGLMGTDKGACSDTATKGGLIYIYGL